MKAHTINLPTKRAMWPQFLVPVEKKNEAADCVMLLTSHLVDEPPRRGLDQQQLREESQQSKNRLANVGSSGLTPVNSSGGDLLETSKTNSGTFSDNSRDPEADEKGKESISTGASLDIASLSTTSGEKAKRLVVHHHCHWES